MATVTYKKQPGIHATRGSVPLAGTSHVYKVNGILWPKEVETWIAERIIPPCLHVCCGKSLLGDVRLDLFEKNVDVIGDAARLPFADQSFACVLIDPPYNGKFQWNHDMLNELHRVSQQRILFQHWFMPIDKLGRFKKSHVFTVSDISAAPKAMVDDVAPAVKIDGQWYVVEDGRDYYFQMTDAVVWSPKSYFGRTQIITVLDRN